MGSSENILALKGILEELYCTYNKREFVSPDPLQFLYDYPDVRDREIVGIVASSLAYGRVAGILKSVGKVLGPMDGAPRDFLMNSSRDDLMGLYEGFCHRFTTREDLVELLWGMRSLIGRYGSLQGAFLDLKGKGSLEEGLSGFVEVLGQGRKNSLLASPRDKSACKRHFLFLRWMVRQDDVDPGGWSGLDPAELVVPLDTHMYQICSTLGFSNRKAADLRTARQVTSCFGVVAPEDPVRYDFALTRFGIRDEMRKESLFKACREIFEEKGCF